MTIVKSKNEVINKLKKQLKCKDAEIKQLKKDDNLYHLLYILNDQHDKQNLSTVYPSWMGESVKKNSKKTVQLPLLSSIII